MVAKIYSHVYNLIGRLFLDIQSYIQSHRKTISTKILASFLVIYPVKIHIELIYMFKVMHCSTVYNSEKRNNQNIPQRKNS